MSQFSARSENLFFREKKPIFGNELKQKFQNFKQNWIFFQLEKTEPQIFEIQKNLSYLNFIWENFEQNQRNFFEREGEREVVTSRYGRGR